MRVFAKSIAVAGLCASSVLFAQHGSHAPAAMTEGEVQAVDQKARNVTLRHGEIKNMQMPAMTMVFNVKEPALLDNIKKGDKVKFKVEAVGGAPTVTAIEPVR